MGASRSGHFVGLEALIKQEKAAAKGLEDVAEASRDAAAFADQLARAFVAPAASPASTAVRTAASNSGGDAAGGAGGALLLAGQIAASIQEAQRPLNTFAANVHTIFDRVAGTIIEGFRRADAASKFPIFDRTISAIGSGLNAFATKVVGVTVDLIFGGKRAKESFSPLIPILAELNAQMDRADSGAGMLARAFARVKGWAPQNHPVPPAGQRPGVGRAIPVNGNAAMNAARFTVEAVRNSVGMVAVELARMASASDDAFARITMRGTIAGNVLRGFFIGLAASPLILVANVADLASEFVKLGQAIFRSNHFISSLGDVAGKTFSQLFKGTLSAASAFKSLGGTLARGATLGTVKGIGKGVSGIAGGMKSAQSATTAFTGSIRRLGVEALAAFGVFGLVFKVGQFFKDGISGAAALNDTVASTRVTFGAFSDEVEGQANKLSAAYGLQKADQLKVAMGFGELAQSAGIAQGASAEFANTFTKLSADLASRGNFESVADAADAINSAMSGKGKVLKQFGVWMDEDSVKAYALSHGLARAGQELSHQAKLTAYAALAQQGLASSTGDLERTQYSATAQFRKAGGGLTNFGIAVGEVLLPAINSGTMAFNDFLATIVEVFEANKPLIMGWGESVKFVMDVVGGLVRNSGSAWEIFRLKTYEAMANAGAYLEAFAANIPVLAGYIGRNWYQLIVDGLNAAKAAFLNFFANVQALGTALGTWLADPTQGFKVDWTPLLDGFKATAEKLPELIKPSLIDVGAQVQAEWDKIQANEDKRRKGIEAIKPDVNRITPEDKEDKDKKKKKSHPFAALAEAGSKEAYSAIIRHQFGGRDDGMKTVAREAPKQTQLLKEIKAGLPGLGVDGVLQILGL